MVNQIHWLVFNRLPLQKTQHSAATHLARAKDIIQSVGKNRTLIVFTLEVVLLKMGRAAKAPWPTPYSGSHL